MTVKSGDIWTIYCHTLGDGRRYIGQTKETMAKRWCGHVARARANMGSASSNPFTNAIRVHGAAAFEHEELEWCISQREADKAEARWIEKFDTRDPRFGFNLQTGGTRVAKRSRAKPATVRPAEARLTPSRSNDVPRLRANGEGRGMDAHRESAVQRGEDGR
jgi:hypothetical protein